MWSYHRKNISVKEYNGSLLGIPTITSVWSWLLANQLGYYLYWMRSAGICLYVCLSCILHSFCVYHVLIMCLTCAHVASRELTIQACLASLNVSTRPTLATSRHKENWMILFSPSSIMLVQWSIISGWVSLDSLKTTGYHVHKDISS